MHHSSMNRNASPSSSSTPGSGNYYGRNNSYNSPHNYYNAHHNTMHSGNSGGGGGGGVGNYRGSSRGGPPRGRGLARGSSSTYRGGSHRPSFSSPSPPIRDHYNKSGPDDRNSRSYTRITENDARNSIRPPATYSQMQSERKFSTYQSSSFNRDTQLIRRRRIPVAFSTGNSRVIFKSTPRITRPYGSQSIASKNSVRVYRANDDRRVTKALHRSKRSKSSWDTSSDETDKNERSVSKRSQRDRTRDKSTAKTEVKESSAAGGSRAESVTENTAGASSSRPSEDRSRVNKSEGTDRKDDEECEASRSADNEPAVKYECAHCSFKSSGSAEYEEHLTGMTHVSEMRRIAKKQRAQLMKMRMDQRFEQRRIERNPKNLSKHTLFCPLCKLNFRQLKSTHQFSQAHRSMKKFLMPYCRPCDISFRSPLIYESHICSLSHIIKARKENSKLDRQSSTNNNSLGNESGTNIPIPDLENCMTIDSTGEIDETAEITESNENNKDTENADDTGDNDVSDAARVETKEKAEIIVGQKYIKIMKVLHCEICQRYVPLENRTEQDMIRLHCSSRQHMNSYANVKDDELPNENNEQITHAGDNEHDAQDASVEEAVVENENKADEKECEPSEEADREKNASEDEVIVENRIEINATSNDEGLEDIPDYEE